jgi:hypothetical protein
MFAEQEQADEKLAQACVFVDFKALNLKSDTSALYHVVTENGNFSKKKVCDTLENLGRTTDFIVRAWGEMREILKLLALEALKPKEPSSQEEYEANLLERFRSHFHPSENEKMDDMEMALKSLRHSFSGINNGCICLKAVNCHNSEIAHGCHFGFEMQLIDLMLKRYYPQEG